MALIADTVDILARGFLLDGSGKAETVALPLDLAASFQFSLSLEPVASGGFTLEVAAGACRARRLIGIATGMVSGTGANRTRPERLEPPTGRGFEVMIFSSGLSVGVGLELDPRPWDSCESAGVV